jgi:hypothetical protein
MEELNKPGKQEPIKGSQQIIDKEDAGKRIAETGTLPESDEQAVMDDPLPLEPSEEDLDEKKNNARDAMNDDTYVLPEEEQDENEPG